MKGKSAKKKESPEAMPGKRRSISKKGGNREILAKVPQFPSIVNREKKNKSVRSGALEERETALWN